MTPRRQPFQLFAPLPAHVEAALRASIDRFGVLVPVVKDQNGRILDGHHRSRIADEMKKEYRVTEMHVTDDVEAKEIARTLNSDRRHNLPEEQRREVIRILAGETVAAGPGGREEVARHSPEAIAAALGVSDTTVRNDIRKLESTSQLRRPAKTIGLDGKARPAKRPEPKPDSPHGRPRKGSASRQPLPEFANKTGWALRKEADKLERIRTDDRLAENKEVVATHLRGHLIYTMQVCQDLLARFEKLTGA